MADGDLLLILLFLFYALAQWVLDDMTTLENIKLLLVLALAVFMGKVLYEWVVAL